MLRILDAVLLAGGIALLGGAYKIGVHPHVTAYLQAKEVGETTAAIQSVASDLLVRADNGELSTRITGGAAPPGLSDGNTAAWDTNRFVWEPISNREGYIIFPVDEITDAWKIDQRIDDGTLYAGDVLLHPNGMRYHVRGR